MIAPKPVFCPNSVKLNSPFSYPNVVAILGPIKILRFEEPLFEWAVFWSGNGTPVTGVGGFVRQFSHQ